MTNRDKILDLVGKVYMGSFNEFFIETSEGNFDYDKTINDFRTFQGGYQDWLFARGRRDQQ